MTGDCAGRYIAKFRKPPITGWATYAASARETGSTGQWIEFNL
jgi:hypothetical protein